MTDVAARPPRLQPPPRRRGRRRWSAALAVGLVGGAAVVAALWLHGVVGTVTLRTRCTATALGASTDLSPEQAGNAATIAALAVRRGLPARAASIAIATAMQESKLINLPRGDRDSLGLFQQRPSQGWGTPAQVLDPVHAANAFFDVLVRIEGYQNMPITAVAQKVQRSAFPSAYADHEPQARIFASDLFGHSQAALTCALRPVAATVGAGRSSTARAEQVAAAAARETGRVGLRTAADPTAIAFPLGGTDGARLRWAVAQWAVARAEGLAVTSVALDGRLWRRDRPDQGWTTTATAASGTVVVRVASGG